MHVHFLGVRGSTPAPGPEHLRYGGHTSCVALSLGLAEAPSLVLDAGTGLRLLPGLLDGAAFRGTILLTHLHWDHVQGLPFCPAVDRDDAEVALHLPGSDGRSASELLERVMSPPAFPITADQLRGSWSFTADGPGRVEGPGFVATGVEVTHKGGRTLGWVVAADGVRVAYVPDHAPALGLDDSVVAALEGVEVLIHGGHMLDSERSMADAFGHATVSDALALAERAAVGSLVLTHHSPVRTDDQLDALGVELGDRAVLARQGMHLDLGAPGPPA